MLDRAGFSPGPIDGRVGKNTKLALDAFQQSGAKETVSPEDAVTAYTITPEDAQGPFVPAIPEDMVEKSKLPALGYTSIVELLAERFHATPALIEQLNTGIAFEAGATIRVPNVEPLAMPTDTSTQPSAEAPRPQQGRAEKPAATGTSGRGGTTGNAIAARPDVVVTVRQSTSDLTVADASGRVLMYAPVTTGSENDPLPIGEWKVKGVQFNPKFHYNPELFWDADPTHSKAVLAAGPNNPVGLVWIDSQQTALRNPRHAGAVHRRPHGVTRVHPPDELGRGEAGGSRQTGYEGGVHAVKVNTRTVRLFASGVGLGFITGAFVVCAIVWQYGNFVGSRAANRAHPPGHPAGDRAVRGRYR